MSARSLPVALPTGHNHAEVRAQLAPTSIRIFERISAVWNVPADRRHELLGVDAPTYVALKIDPLIIGDAQIERIALIVGIYGELATLLPVDEAADQWVRKANVVFDGGSALDLMLSPDTAGLRHVHSYLRGIVGE